MDNVKIDKFEFWQPVSFDKITPTANQNFDFLWRIGSWADQFASIGSSHMMVFPERVNIRKYSFEKNREQLIPAVQTALKVALYVLTLFVLPLAALAIKIIFKWKLNEISMLKENPNTFIAGKEIGKTRVVLATGSLLDETTDAVTNAANARLLAGGGICGAFHKQAGDAIFDECEDILKTQKRKAVDTGEAVLTTAGDLAPRIKAIVHAVGPVYDDNKGKKIADSYKKEFDKADDERKTEIREEIAKKIADYNKEQAQLLGNAYTSSLELITAPDSRKKDISSEIADPQPMRTIGFPSIATGIYDFPLDLAAKTAMESVKAFVEKNPDALDEVRFVFLPLDKDKQKTANFYVDALANL